MGSLLGKVSKNISPYIPGEQPRDKEYIKLNTNENPYSPSLRVKRALSDFDFSTLSLYPDPTCTTLKKAVSEMFSLPEDWIFAGNGSDEVLAFAFNAFASIGDNVYFPDITYGFYKVYANLYQLKARQIPLKKDFSIDVNDYKNLDGNIFIANPNAPTGLALSLDEIEEIIKTNSGNLVVIDEAYIDFSSVKSAICLIEKYDNLLVVQTTSKSRALAGLRLGFGFGNPKLIDGLMRIKYSTNPYNLNSISLKIGEASLRDKDYFEKTVKKVVATRERTSKVLVKLGFKVLKSETNFLFIEHDKVRGEEFYKKLKEAGILVRHFSDNRISNFIRVTIGTEEDMNMFLERIKLILKEGLK